jgi:hypothetical protein
VRFGSNIEQHDVLKISVTSIGSRFSDKLDGLNESTQNQLSVKTKIRYDLKHCFLAEDRGGDSASNPRCQDSLFLAGAVRCRKWNLTPKKF